MRTAAAIRKAGILFAACVALPSTVLADNQSDWACEFRAMFDVRHGRCELAELVAFACADFEAVLASAPRDANGAFTSVQSFYDGRLAGRDLEAWCGVCYECTTPGGDLYWRYLGAPKRTDFPSASWLFGSTGLVRWEGLAGYSIPVRFADDSEDPNFNTRYLFAFRMAALHRLPSAVLLDAASRMGLEPSAAAPLISHEIVETACGRFGCDRLLGRGIAEGIEYAVATREPDASGESRSILVIREVAEEGKALLLMVQSRAVSAGGLVPRNESELQLAFSDVSGIDRAEFHDWTDSTGWPAATALVSERPSLRGSLIRAVSRTPLSFWLNSATAVAAAISLLYFHVRTNRLKRRLQNV